MSVWVSLTVTTKDLKPVRDEDGFELDVAWTNSLWFADGRGVRLSLIDEYGSPQVILSHEEATRLRDHLNRALGILDADPAERRGVIRP